LLCWLAESQHTPQLFRFVQQFARLESGQFGWLTVILLRAFASGGFVQTVTVSGFVKAAARIVGKQVASFKAGPRFVSRLRHTAVPNPRLVRTPGTVREFPVTFVAGAAQPERYVVY
jgi:hypothetical protein